jgi:hypothetical protein
MSGDWRGKVWKLIVTFCTVTIRCTETFWSPSIHGCTFPCAYPTCGILEPPRSYSLTPHSRVLLENLTSLCSQSRNSPYFYGTRKFFTVLTSARHLSLTWASSIQSPQPPPTSWRSILTPRLGYPNILEAAEQRLGVPRASTCTVKVQAVKA